MTVWWGWLLIGVAIGVALAVFVLRESRLWVSTRRGGTIDLVGATPRDPDDWFA